MTSKFAIAYLSKYVCCFTTKQRVLLRKTPNTYLYLINIHVEQTNCNFHYFHYFIFLFLGGGVNLNFFPEIEILNMVSYFFFLDITIVEIQSLHNCDEFILNLSSVGAV